MNKAFVREDVSENDDEATPAALPAGRKNYITPTGYAALQRELKNLADVERPKIVETVHWAAKNGDRSENGDYLYGKKKLREIDRRIRFLSKRLEIAEVIDPSAHYGGDQVFFGATVRYIDEDGNETAVSIKGIDEADALHGEISWISPVAHALLRTRVGDTVMLRTPGGEREIEILSVEYPKP